MSKAVSCDRCGKFEKIPVSLLSQNPRIFNGPGWEEITTRYDAAADTINSFSLCPSCAGAFNEFMKNGENNASL